MGKRLAFVFGFVSGMMAGWLLGIFSAPQSGKETLTQIGEKAEEWRELVGQTADRVRDEVMGPLNSASNVEADLTTR